MVAPGFVPGSVDIPFVAKVEQMQKGVKQAQDSIKTFGKQVQTTGKTVKAQAKEMNKALAQTGKASADIANRAAAGIQRLLSLQLVIQQFSGKAGLKAFGREIKATTDGLVAFAAIVTVMPGQLGLAIGAVAAVSVVLLELIGISQEAIKVQKEFADFVDRSGEFFQKLGNQVKETTRLLVAFGATDAEVARANVSTLQNQIKALEQFTDQVKAKRRETALLLVTQSGDVARELQALLGQQDIELQRAFATRERLIKTAATVQAKAAIEEFKRFAASLQTGFKRIQAESADALTLGIADPLQRATLEVKNAEAAVIQFQAQLREMNKIIQDPKVDEALRERLRLLVAGGGGTRFSGLLDQLRQAQQREAAARAPQEFAQAFSEPFADAIGQATFNGILEGKKAMVIVADVGQRLFENFLGQAITNFQTGMVAAFKSIAGEGGAVLGNLFTGLVGLAGFFLSNKAGSEQAFEGVSSAIESSQAVRGIVAGPTNVAIAQVGEDLRRALAPLQAVAERQLGELIAIRNNTQGGGGGAGALDFAGTVPTA